MGLIDKLIRGSYKNEKKPLLFPKNRKEVFAQLFRYHKRTLVNVSLMCALFALPTVAAVMLAIIYKTNIPALIADGSITPPSTENAELGVVLLELQIDRLLGLILIPTNALLFIGLSGGLHVIRLAAWGENVAFFHDFGCGIKRNWTHFLLYAVLFGISLFFCIFVIGYYSVAEVHAAIKAISIAIAVLQFVIVVGTLVFALSHADVYASSIIKELKNSFIFFIAELPVNFGLLLLTALPLLLLLIPLTVVQTIASVLITLLFPAYAILIWVLRGDKIFDKYLNVGENERIAGKGIVWEEPDEKNDNNS